MYSSFSIRNFRGIRDLELSGLARFVLVTGRNDTGKTSALEAVFVHAGAGQPQVVPTIEALRGLPATRIEGLTTAENPWLPIFHDFDASEPIRLEGVFKGKARVVSIEAGRPGDSGSMSLPSSPTDLTKGETATAIRLLHFQVGEGRSRKRYNLTIDQGQLRVEPIPPPVTYQTIFSNAVSRAERQDIDRFSQLRVTGEHAWIGDALRYVDPRIKELAIASPAGELRVFADVGQRRLVSLAHMGMGVGRLFTYATSIGSAPGGVVLIDEVENGLHHATLPSVWRALIDAARRFDVQLIVTTHSLECTVAAHEAFRDTDYDLSLIRLDRLNGEIVAKQYSQDALEGALKTGLEVR